MKSNTVHESIYHKLAQYYDTMHKEHPYKAQTDFADTAFQKYGTAGRCVLDICCGTGGHAEYMVEKGYDITGIDMSQDMLAVAERKFLSRARRPSFIQRDVTKLDSDEEFDGAYCFNAFFHNYRQDEKSEAYRISVAHPGEWARFVRLDSYELRMFFHDELMFLLESSGFKPIVVYSDDLASEVSAGSHFITFVARKDTESIQPRALETHTRQLQER